MHPSDKASSLLMFYSFACRALLEVMDFSFELKVVFSHGNRADNRILPNQVIDNLIHNIQDDFSTWSYWLSQES